MLLCFVLAQCAALIAPYELLTSTQVAAEPFVFEETAQGKALWKRPKNRVRVLPDSSFVCPNVVHLDET